MTLARFLLISQFMATLAVENGINSYTIQDNLSSNQRILQTRSLEVGDFDNISQLFNGTTIILPDTDFNQGGLQLGLRSLQCKELIIGDITSQWNTYNSSSAEISVGYEETLAYEINVSPFSLTCSADYSWALSNIGFLRGSGNLVAISTNSNAKARIDFNSVTGFQNDFPSNVDFQSCEATLNIDDINFEGGLMGDVLSLAENLISSFVEDQVKKLICDKLIEAGPPVFNKFFNKTSFQINEWMQPVSDESADPLYIENNIRSENRTLINFMSVTNESSIFESIKSLIVEQNTISSLIPFAINQVDSFLGRKITDSGKSEIYFNVLLRKTNILDENRVLDFKFDGNDKIPAFQADPILFKSKNPIQVEIKLNGVRAAGLDTATNISALNAIGAQTLQTTLSWDVLDFEFDLSVSLKSSESPDSLFFNPEPRDVMENISVSLSFYNIVANVSLFIAMNDKKLEDLQLGSLMQIENILPCLLETIEDLQISGLAVSFANYTKPMFSGFETPGLERLALSALDAALVAFEPTVLQSFPNILQGPVRKALNDRVLPPLLEDRTCPKVTNKPNETSFIDLRDLLLPAPESTEVGGTGKSPYGNLLPSLYKIMKDEFFSNETQLVRIINDLLSSFTSSNSGTPGAWMLNKDFLNVDNKIQAGGLDASIQLRAYDAYIKNLNTVGTPMSFLKPVDGTLLNSTAAIGVQNPLSLGISLFIGLSTEDVKIENDLEISIGLDQLQLLATAVLKLSEKALLEFPMRDILNLNCWLATMPTPQLDSYGVRVIESEKSLGLTEFISSIEKLQLNVTCKQCSGSKWSELTNLLMSDSNAVEVTDIGKKIFDLVTKLAEGQFLSVAIDRALNEAPKKCPHSSAFVETNYTKEEYLPFEVEASSEDSTSFLFALLLVCAGLIVFILVVHLIIKVVIRRRYRKWVDNLNQQQIVFLCKHQTEKKENEKQMNQSTSSMYVSSSIPLFVRVSMPIIIIGNIAFFISGHLSLGASVTILVSLGGQTVRSDDFFSFSMAQSISEIWNAGGQALALMIFFASVAWPYTKQILSLALWFTPTRFVSVSRRGSIFLWLDTLAKWSMVDIFVLVVTIVCLKVSIQSPGVAFLPEDFYQIDLLVVPKWGLYANMIAQLISQISSHAIIHYHRRIVEDAESRNLESNNTAIDSEDPESVRSTSSSDQPPESSFLSRVNHEDDQTPEKLCAYAFRRIHRAENGKLIARRYVNLLLVMLATTVSVLVTVGCVLPLFSVNILGLIGVLVESGKGFREASTGYSVFGVIEVLFGQANLTNSFADYIGLGTLSVIVVLTVLVVPILQAIVLIVQWFATLNQQQRRKLSVWTEILAAWQYVEVYVISIVIASWQLGPISDYIVNPYCAALQNTFRQLVFYGIFKAEDAQCLKTDIVIDPTFYILLTASLALALLNTFIMKATSQYMDELNNVNVTLTNSKESYDGVSAEDEKLTKEDIDDVPIQFTDRFRWVLHNKENARETSMANVDTMIENESVDSVDWNKSISDEKATDDNRQGELHNIDLEE